MKSFQQQNMNRARDNSARCHGIHKVTFDLIVLVWMCRGGPVECYQCNPLWSKILIQASFQGTQVIATHSDLYRYSHSVKVNALYHNSPQAYLQIHQPTWPSVHVYACKCMKHACAGSQTIGQCKLVACAATGSQGTCMYLYMQYYMYHSYVHAYMHSTCTFMYLSVVHPARQLQPQDT